MSQQESKESYCVIYRVGGRERFEWRHSLPMAQIEAVKAASETMQMGYPVMIDTYKHIQSIGLPETFDVRDAVTL